MVHTEYIDVHTRGDADIHDITSDVQARVSGAAIGAGLCCVFVPGSTGAITTIEFEPGVVEDLRQAIERIAPADIEYRHDRAWGDGNGHSHVRAALLGPSLTVPVIGGALQLGTWQQIVFVDFDNRSRRRRLIVQVVGE